MEIKTNTCKERVSSQLRGRIRDIRKLWNLYGEDPDKYDDELGNFNEYGLCLDYVAPGTFNDQKHGYIRYQISWGGPSDEFRFYLDEKLNPTRIEYLFMGWFDGAKIILHGKDYDLMEEIYQNWNDCETIQYLIEHSVV